ncbi:olfactory receptor 5V1-like [Python bivittatus]|uniref:Olfactory receptor n=1 Tax=Python bivittatus TaxID=176946 RepID=A0A9F2RDQ9_PYTBI|nr:olfactory receptor 5V1-like [Python bivittatus]
MPQDAHVTALLYGCPGDQYASRIQDLDAGFSDVPATHEELLLSEGKWAHLESQAERELGTATTKIAMILANLLLQRNTIPYNHCLAQMFFLIGFTGSECWLLAIMAYDRYAAICQPLRYSHLMSPRVCMAAAIIAWIGGFLDAAVHTALASNLNFCRANQIHHIFCDLPPLLKIACGDKFVSEIAIHLATVFVGLGPFLFVVISYVYILASILHTHSNSGRHKAFSTCISHVVVVILYFGNGSVNYNQPSSGYSLQTDTLISTMYCIVTPMLNPLIYSLRNKEVKEALWKLLGSPRRI